jgi:hypothetical protein
MDFDRREGRLLPGTADDRRDGPQEDLEVEQERPAVDIGQVSLHPPVELRLVARLHLPEPGDPRLHAESL